MAHLSTGLARLIGGELAVGAWDLDVGWHVTVRTGQGRSLDTSRRELSLQGLALATILSLLMPTEAVALEALPFHLRVFRRWHTLIKVLQSGLKDLLLLFLLLLKLESLRLEHGELRDCGQHLARQLGSPSLVFVDLLSDFKGGFATIKGLSSQFLSQVADLLIDEFLLEQALLLVVKAFLKHMDFGKECFLVRILTWKVHSVWMLCRVLQLLGQLLHLGFLVFEIVIDLHDFLGELGDFGDLLADDRQLPLPLLQLKVDHPDLFLFLTNLLLASLEDVFLDVRFFVKDTKLIITVDKLNTHVVSALAGMLVLVDEVVHLFLERVNDQVELVSLVDQLSNCGELLTELELFAVQLRPVLVSHGHCLHLLLVDVDQVSVLLRTLVLQDVHFVLEDLDSLLHLGQVLATGLDLRNVLVSRVLHLLVKSDKSVQLEVSVLLLLRQI